MLERNSIEVEGFGSAKATLDFLKTGELVDVIVSDVRMPHMDGFAFVQQLQSDNRTNNIPVILCTALSDKASVMKGIEAGIAGYIVKPVKESILIPKVKKIRENSPWPILSNSPGSILVVDDQELVRDILIKTLERAGYKVLASESGASALDLLKNNNVAMVLSDIAMPNMDGFELLALVKIIDASIPVILMSGRSEYRRDNIVSRGADDFITKPFNNTEILARVGALYT